MTVPDSPMTARFLTAEEKPMALERVRANQQGQRVREFKKYHVIEALTDPLVSGAVYGHCKWPLLMNPLCRPGSTPSLPPSSPSLTVE